MSSTTSKQGWKDNKRAVGNTGIDREGRKDLSLRDHDRFHRRDVRSAVFNLGCRGGTFYKYLNPGHSPRDSDLTGVE